MKCLSKYIIKSIIEHSTLDDFGQFLLMSRNVTTGFEVLISQLKKSFNLVRKGIYLCHAKYQTEKICLESVKRNANNISFVKNETLELCLTAVKQEGYMLQNMETQTLEICLAAVNQNRDALFFVRDEFLQEVLNQFPDEGSL